MTRTLIITALTLGLIVEMALRVALIAFLTISIIGMLVIGMAAEEGKLDTLTRPVLLPILTNILESP